MSSWTLKGRKTVHYPSSEVERRNSHASKAAAMEIKHPVKPRGKRRSDRVELTHVAQAAIRWLTKPPIKNPVAHLNP